MNHLIWPVSLVGILSTAVVYGTDMFFLTVGRPGSQVGFAICRNRSHGIYPYLR